MTTVSADRSRMCQPSRLCLFEEGQTRTRYDEVGCVVWRLGDKSLIDLTSLGRREEDGLASAESAGSSQMVTIDVHLFAGCRNGVFRQVVRVARVRQVFGERRRDDLGRKALSSGDAGVNVSTDAEKLEVAPPLSARH